MAVEEKRVYLHQQTNTKTKIMKIVKIILVTEKLGNFNFEEHFNSTSNFYQAMCLFESNNWRKLGETSYSVFTAWEDGTTTKDTFDGMNATANLAGFMEEA